MKKTLPKALKTKRLIVAPLSDCELSRRIGDEQDEHMKAALAEMLGGCLEHQDERLWYTLWEMRLKGSGEAVGCLGFKGAPVNGEVEIGYGVDEAFRLMGYGAEAVKAAGEWAFSQENVFFVMAESEAENEASIRLLKKLGYKPAGNGEEGPRFELEKPQQAWLSVCICMGLSLGMCFGMPYDNIAIGMSIGTCVGVVLGLFLDASEKKKRDSFNRARKESKEA